MLSKLFRSEWVQRILIFLVCLTGCGLCWMVWQAANGEYDPQPVVVLLADEAGAEYIELGAIDTSDPEYIVQHIEPESNSLPAALQELCDHEDFELKAVVIATESGSRTGQLAIRLLQKNIPVVMAGPAPGSAVLKSPMAWYVGSTAAGGGEELGGLFAAEFRDGALPDLNDDHLMQYIAFGEDETPFSAEFLQAFLIGCEHYGVYNAPLSLTEAEAQETPEGQAAGTTLSGAPELILFGGRSSGDRALAVAAEHGLLESESPTLLGGFAMTETEAKEMVEAGAMAAVYCDLVTVTRTVRTLVRNLAAEEAPLMGLDIPADGQQFHIPLLVYEG